MWFNSRKILRATAVASPLRGRPEMRHATSVRFHDLALGKRPAVFTIVINQVDGNALSRSRHLQLLIQFNRYCRIDRLQRSCLVLHGFRIEAIPIPVRSIQRVQPCAVWNFSGPRRQYQFKHFRAGDRSSRSSHHALKFLF